MVCANCPSQASHVLERGKCCKRLGHKSGPLAVQNGSQIARPNYPLWNIPPKERAGCIYVPGQAGATWAGNSILIRRHIGIQVPKEAPKPANSKSTWRLLPICTCHLRGIFGRWTSLYAGGYTCGQSFQVLEGPSFQRWFITASQ